MRILALLRKELIGKRLISCSEIELNDDDTLNIDYYIENDLDIPTIGEVIIAVGDGYSVDSNPTVRLHFSEGRYHDVFLDHDLELE